MIVRRCVYVVVLLVLGAVVSPVRAHAANGPVPVTYPFGWNMVAGPPGTDLSSAEAVYAYTSGSYTTPSNLSTQLCQGYWAYFSMSQTLVLAVSTTSSTTSQVCPLAPGWNMVGNPFTVPASLPPSTVAYHWNAGAGQYELVHTIPQGSAVWIYSDTASSVALQALQGSSSTILITLPPPATPYQVRVGDTLSLVLPGGLYGDLPIPTVTADSAYLKLVASGRTDTNVYWTWQAIAPGLTTITIQPSCYDMTPRCLAPAFAIQVNIQS